MIRKRLAPVLSLQPLSALNHFVLTFDAGEIAADAQPGQFIAVAATSPANPGAQILRKPFSFFTADPETGVASILFSLFGPTTRAMASYRSGDTLDLIGPLGGRVFSPAAGAQTHHVLVGGGYGVPPLAFFGRRIKAADPSATVTLVLGARTANLLVGADGLPEAGIEVLACTDDGSAGFSGKVTGRLEQILGESDRPVCVYTCGPTPMMRAVAQLCLARGVACQVSMETFMPCGVGICVGCAVGRPDGTYARACTDGPVFPAGEIVW